MYLIHKIVTISLLLFLIPTMLFSQSSKSVALEPMGELSNVNLKPDYAYYNFDVNQDYLVWYEGYMHKIFVYDLSSNKLRKITLKEGRGPQEFVEIFDVTILPKDDIYLTDNINQKLIQLKPTGEYLKDFVFSSGIRPVKYITNENYNVVMDVFKQDAVFYLETKSSYKPLKVDEVYGSGGSFDIFKKEGYVTVNKDHLIHLTKYYPHLYIYNLKTGVFSKKIKFDESKIEQGSTTSRSDGAKVMAPPAKVDIRSEDVAYTPGAPNRIFLLAKGKSDTRDYDLDTVYEYDFEKEEFIATHDLGVKATEITVSGNKLFVYSKEENQIFQYEIIPSE